MRQTSVCLLFCLSCVGCSTLATDPGSLLYRFKNRDTVQEREALLLKQADEAREQKLWEVAESRYCELLQIRPQHEVAINNLGRLYFDQGKYHLAALRFSQALEISEQPAVHLNHLGMVHEASGRWTAAEEYYQQAIELDPECVVYQAQLARVYVRQNRTDFAVEALLEVVVEKDDRHGWRDWANLQLIKLRNKNLRASEAQAVVGNSGVGGNQPFQPRPEFVLPGSVLEGAGAEGSIAPPAIPVESASGAK